MSNHYYLLSILFEDYSMLARDEDQAPSPMQNFCGLQKCDILCQKIKEKFKNVSFRKKIF